jgi:hypothetical protein
VVPAVEELLFLCGSGHLLGAVRRVGQSTAFGAEVTCEFAMSAVRLSYDAGPGRWSTIHRMQPGRAGSAE